MSRRTKLIMFAIFLVLLAIPAVYVVLTWHPATPLRCRLMHVYPEVSLDSEPSRMLRVSLENSSMVPIHFFFADIAVPRETLDLYEPPGYINPQFQMEGGGTSGGKVEIILPPHSTTHVTAIVRSDLLDDAEDGRLNMHYLWMSQTKLKADEALCWLRDNCPSFMVDHLPAVTKGDDVIPLEGIGK